MSIQILHSAGAADPTFTRLERQYGFVYEAETPEHQYNHDLAYLHQLEKLWNLKVTVDADEDLVLKLEILTVQLALHKHEQNRDS